VGNDPPQGGTPPQSWTEAQRLKKAIRKSLQADRQARLDRAVTEIKEAMQVDSQRGYQLLGRWYKRLEG
jgi:hypothetical protein